MVLGMFRVFGYIGPNLDQIWAWLPRGHRLAVGVRDPLKSSVTGPSLLVNCYLETKFHKKIRVTPPPLSNRRETFEQRKKNKCLPNAKTVIKNIKVRDLMSRPENKQRICNLFAKRSISTLYDKEKKFVVCYGTTITSNIADWTALANEQDEFDSLIICVIVWVVRLQRVNNNLNLTVRILSPDANFLYLHGTVLYSQHRRVQHHVRVLKQQVQEGNLSCY